MTIYKVTGTIGTSVDSVSKEKVPSIKVTKAVPAVLTMVLMPLSFSISEGIAIGFLVYVLLMVGIGRARQVSVVGYVLGALFLLHILTR